MEISFSRLIRRNRNRKADFSYPLAMVVGGGFGLAGHEVLGKNHGREHMIDSVVAGSPSPRKRPTSRLHALGARARAVVWRDDGIARFGINCALVIGLNR